MDETWWIWWLVAAATLIVAELFTGTFVLLMLGAGALAASLVGVFGGPLWAQFLAFGVVSALALAVVRPWMKERWFRQGDDPEMGLNRTIGAEALVVEQVNRGGGQVKIDGELWRARAHDNESVFKPGERVRVIEVDGATALIGRNIDG